MLNSCDFGFFKNKKFERLDLADKKTRKKIRKIYRSLSKFKGIRYVGATKIMHLLQPKVFVMWDRKIIQKYKAKTTSKGYLDFMIEMQRKYKAGEFGRLKTKNVTIPRAIDIYNLERLT